MPTYTLPTKLCLGFFFFLLTSAGPLPNLIKKTLPIELNSQLAALSAEIAAKSNFKGSSSKSIKSSQQQQSPVMSTRHHNLQLQQQQQKLLLKQQQATQSCISSMENPIKSSSPIKVPSINHSRNNQQQQYQSQTQPIIGHDIIPTQKQQIPSSTNLLAPSAILAAVKSLANSNISNNSNNNINNNSSVNNKLEPIGRSSGVGCSAASATISPLSAGGAQRGNGVGANNNIPSNKEQNSHGSSGSSTTNSSISNKSTTAHQQQQQQVLRQTRSPAPQDESTAVNTAQNRSNRRLGRRESRYTSGKIQAYQT